MSSLTSGQGQVGENSPYWLTMAHSFCNKLSFMSLWVVVKHKVSRPVISRCCCCCRGSPCCREEVAVSGCWPSVWQAPPLSPVSLYLVWAPSTGCYYGWCNSRKGGNCCRGYKKLKLGEAKGYGLRVCSLRARAPERSMNTWRGISHKNHDCDTFKPLNPWSVVCFQPRGNIREKVLTR